MRTLQEIGKDCGGDKWNICFAGKSYLQMYSQYFDPIREKVAALLEIGVSAGCSLRMWREYFQCATIWGIDVDPNCQSSKEERINVITASQDDGSAYDGIKDLDIVIDDGSHINELTIKAFELVSPKVRPGGFYIIEDSGCTYAGDVRPLIKSGGWPGMEHNRRDINYINKRDEFQRFLWPMISDIDACRGDWEFVHFWSRTIIMRKRRDIEHS